jgi:hypothetical protein
MLSERQRSNLAWSLAKPAISKGWYTDSKALSWACNASA